MFAPSAIFRNWRVAVVEAAAADGRRFVIPAGGVCTEFSSLPLLSFDGLFSEGCADCAKISIEFLTPLRIVHQGRSLREIPFSSLAGALFRRISSLAYYYGQEELPHDFKWLAQLSRAVSGDSSSLSWANRGGGLQGVEGVAEFRGELAEFIPFILLGSRLNVGKGAAYGMGSYRFSLA